MDFPVIALSSGNALSINDEMAAVRSARHIPPLTQNGYGSPKELVNGNIVSVVIVEKLFNAHAHSITYRRQEEPVSRQ